MTRVEAAPKPRKLTQEQQEVLQSLAELMVEVFCSLAPEERVRYMLDEQLIAA